MTSTQNTFANGLKDTFNKHTNMNFGENGASEHSPKVWEVQGVLKEHLLHGMQVLPEMLLFQK